MRGGDLSAWLYRVAQMAAAKAVRNRVRRAEREERYAADEVGGGEAPVLDEADRQAVLDAVDAELMALSARNRAAAWRAGRVRDVRVVPLLVKAAKDADATTARQALDSLRRLNWDAVAALDAAGIERPSSRSGSQPTLRPPP